MASFPSSIKRDTGSSNNRKGGNQGVSGVSLARNGGKLPLGPNKAQVKKAPPK